MEILCLTRKLKRLKDPLKKLNKENFGDIKNRVERARMKLEDA